MRTVLIADNDSFQRQLIDMLLAVDNHRILGFDTGRGVLEYLQSHVPDLVIVDYNLPDINGADLCAKMKGVKRLAGVPVILVTAAHKLELVRGVARAVRANLVLAKPLGDKQLREQVLGLLALFPDKVAPDKVAPDKVAQAPSSVTPIQVDPILEQALENLKHDLPAQVVYAEVTKVDAHRLDANNAITPVPIDRDEPAPDSLELPHSFTQPSTNQPADVYLAETPVPLFLETASDSPKGERQNSDFQNDANTAPESLLGKAQNEATQHETTPHETTQYEITQPSFENDSDVSLLFDDGAITEQELLASLTTPLESKQHGDDSFLTTDFLNADFLNADAPQEKLELNPPPFLPEMPSNTDPTFSLEPASSEPQAYTLGGATPLPASDMSVSFEDAASEIEAEMTAWRTQGQQLSAENERLRATLLELDRGGSLATTKSYLDMVEELELLRRLSDIQIKQLDSLQRQNQKLMEEAQAVQERKRGLFGFLQPKH
jgi:CheY-like chemotaxis protein